ncbi:MAG: hypothetical protein U1E84_16565 [Rhodoferax sp.]
MFIYLLTSITNIIYSSFIANLDLGTSPKATDQRNFVTHPTQINNPTMRTAYGAVLRVTRTDWQLHCPSYCHSQSEFSKGSANEQARFESSFASPGGGG